MTSRRRHISPQAEQYGTLVLQDEEAIGIDISGWKICTNQGSIANESIMNSFTDELQDMAQYTNQNEQRQQRRLCLPEMVFADGYVDICSSATKIKCNAFDALADWARAHQEIAISSESQHNGVSVLKSSDAELWNSKRFTGTSSSVFDYDWTFSSPSCIQQCGSWTNLQQSGMPMHLLQDTTVPILLFDHIILYEDDLHDNGQVSFTCKVRVMPTCVFLLQRLWLRVDGVVLRCRDTRLLVEFSSGAIYRDVQWRECVWDDLATHDLPTDTRTWRKAEEDSNPASFQGLLQKLPPVSLPSGICAHAMLQQQEENGEGSLGS